METENNSNTVLWGIGIVVGGYFAYKAYQAYQVQQIIANPAVRERMEARRAQEERTRQDIVDNILGAGGPDKWIPW